MSLSARDVMSSDVATVAPEMTLPDLERAFIERRMRGFPVVSDGRLVGIVSRSDVVRSICVERSREEMLSDYYRDIGDWRDDTAESFHALGERLGVRIESLHVADAMVASVVTVSPQEPVDAVARLLVDRRLHRVPVVDGDRLVGILSSYDLVQLLADGRAKTA